MNARSVLRWVLLLVVFGSVGIYALRKLRRDDVASPTGSSSQDLVAATVVVTYFTTDVRCDSCRTIEKLSREAIAVGFPDEVASGQVVFRMVNTDRAENRHFVDDYEITNKTVIVSHQQSGRETEWTNRQDVWLLFEQPEEFFAYVREPVQRYLGKS